MTTCRSCGAAITWAETENGKRIPLDADPVARVDSGLFVIRPEGGAVRATTVGGRQLYRSHFATCPDAAQHRRAR